MNIVAIKTDKILAGQKTIFEILDTFLPELEERSIVVITSKIISLCENRVIPFDSIDLESLIKQESDYFLETTGKYDQHFTITKNILIARAGIDMSRKNNHYILWPKNAQNTANEIRHYLSKKIGLDELGVIITDSTSMPLHLGVTGIALGFSGLKPLNHYAHSQANIVYGLSAAAVVAMGEGKEQTPLALITDLELVNFTNQDPAREDIDAMNVALENDFFAPILNELPWQKGSRQKS